MILASGSTFGPYRILEPLGRGGMASVYRAYEQGLDRYVALKILPGEFLHDEGFAERFRREAKVIARLEHPNIVPIYGFGIEEKSRAPWMAMRVINGGPLSGIMKKSLVAPGHAVTILRGAAEALDYAHAKGVIHRDIKPQNILLDEAERVYLADFGIAKMVEAAPGLTQTGMITGTPQYMAPEQALASTVDHRVDIYALGIVAYEMLTGRVPFTADTPVGLLMKHVQEPIPVPSPHDVPEPIVRALLKALAKRPEDRWPSASAFVKALADALSTVSTVGVMPRPASIMPTQAVPRPSADTPAGGVPYPQAVGAPYPATPPAGTGYTPPPRPTSGYPTGHRHPAPGLPQSPTHVGRPTAAPPPAPWGGPVRGLVLGVVAAAAVMGVIGTAALLLLLRPRAAEAPPRPPVTLRSPAVAEGNGVTTAPPPEPSAIAVPTTTAPTATAPTPRPRPASTPRSSAPATLPAHVREETLPPVTTPATLPPVPEVRPAAPAALAFPGAGRVEAGEKFYEKTLAFEVSQPLAVGGHVGPLKVPTVLFSVGEKRGLFERPGEASRAEVRAVFAVDCPTGAGKWDYKMIVELLDQGGRTIMDRFDGNGSCENTIKVASASRVVPKALVPSIRGVKVRIEASRH